jgi:acrylyl-CoA reductase (NADPH)
MFNAIQLTQHDGKTEAVVKSVEASALPEGNVTVDIEYSTLNYKDGLAITGRGPIVRHWPMVPGIDFAGTVAESVSPDFKPGDKVILTGWGVGESHWGGLAQKARVPSDYLVPMPAGLTSRHAMAIGTAGLTAMLCVLAIERDVAPEAGQVLVTGANGGVGSFAVRLLSKRGFKVVASTGRMQEAERLKALGAHEVIGRDQLSAPGKPLQKERWAAVVDCVGSHTLANACAATQYGGVVAACGLAQGMDFPATVAPFILRGVTLVGVDSVKADVHRRLAAWMQLQQTLSAGEALAMTNTVGLAQAIPAAFDLVDGKIAGRLIVDVNA